MRSLQFWQFIWHTRIPLPEAAGLFDSPYREIRGIQNFSIEGIIPRDLRYQDLRSCLSNKLQQNYDLEDEIVEYIRETTCIRSQGKSIILPAVQGLVIAGIFSFVRLVMESLYAQEQRLRVLEEITFPNGIQEAWADISSKWFSCFALRTWEFY